MVLLPRLLQPTSSSIVDQMVKVNPTTIQRTKDDVCEPIDNDDEDESDSEDYLEASEEDDAESDGGTMVGLLA